MPFEPCILGLTIAALGASKTNSPETPFLHQEIWTSISIILMAIFVSVPGKQKHHAANFRAVIPFFSSFFLTAKYHR
jgi:hypothetical protein